MNLTKPIIDALDEGGSLFAQLLRDERTQIDAIQANSRLSDRAKAEDTEKVHEFTGARMREKLAQHLDEIKNGNEPLVRELDKEIEALGSTRSPAEETRLGREQIEAQTFVRLIEHATVEDLDMIERFVDSAFESDRPSLVEPVYFGARMQLRRLVQLEAQGGQTPPGEMTRSKRLWTQIENRYAEWQRVKAKTSPVVRRANEIAKGKQRIADVERDYSRVQDLRNQGYYPDTALPFRG